MSRSYKKVGGWTDYSKNRTKWYKRYSSKIVRRFDGEISDGCSYKKLYESYNIRDYKFLVFNKNEVYYVEPYKAFIK